MRGLAIVTCDTMEAESTETKYCTCIHRNKFIKSFIRTRDTPDMIEKWNTTENTEDIWDRAKEILLRPWKHSLDNNLKINRAACSGTTQVTRQQVSTCPIWPFEPLCRSWDYTRNIYPGSENMGVEHDTTAQLRMDIVSSALKQYVLIFPKVMWNIKIWNIIILLEVPHLSQALCLGTQTQKNKKQIAQSNRISVTHGVQFPIVKCSKTEKVTYNSPQFGDNICWTLQ